MGWDGIPLWQLNGRTNKELLLSARSSIRKGYEEGKYLLSQSGSDVFILYQCDIENSEYFGKYFVACYLCRRNRKEFLIKDIDAITNRCLFPKKWIEYLDGENEEVKNYIAWRKEYDAKKKTEEYYEIGDYVRCVNTTGSTIEWNDGKKIKADESFYVSVDVLNPYSKKKNKAFVICDLHKNVFTNKYEFVRRPYRVNSSSFQEVQKKRVSLFGYPSKDENEELFEFNYA